MSALLWYSVSFRDSVRHSLRMLAGQFTIWEFLWPSSMKSLLPLPSLLALFFK